MNNPVVYDYKGSQISFSLGENVMANATEMAKPFGKQPIDWLKTNQSKDYIETFSKLKFISLADLVQVTKGGNNPGTWMHEEAERVSRILGDKETVEGLYSLKELTGFSANDLNNPVHIIYQFTSGLLNIVNDGKSLSA